MHASHMFHIGSSLGIGLFQKKELSQLSCLTLKGAMQCTSENEDAKDYKDTSKKPETSKQKPTNINHVLSPCMQASRVVGLLSYAPRDEICFDFHIFVLKEEKRVSR